MKVEPHNTQGKLMIQVTINFSSETIVSKKTEGIFSVKETKTKTCYLRILYSEKKSIRKESRKDIFS